MRDARGCGDDGGNPGATRRGEPSPVKTGTASVYAQNSYALHYISVPLLLTGLSRQVRHHLADSRTLSQTCEAPRSCPIAIVAELMYRSNCLSLLRGSARAFPVAMPANILAHVSAYFINPT
jgi:hypothetical protein